MLKRALAKTPVIGPAFPEVFSDNKQQPPIMNQQQAEAFLEAAQLALQSTAKLTLVVKQLYEVGQQFYSRQNQEQTSQYAPPKPRP